MSYQVLAYYLFTSIENPEEEVRRHLEFFAGRDVACRIYLSTEGINGQMSAVDADAEAYQQWLRSDPRFKEIVFKVHRSEENVFPRITVKVRKQLVALDHPVDLSMTGEHVSPAKWREMLEKRDEETLLIDVRNDYEWRLGHFEGAELPPKEQFRHFPEYAQKLKEKCNPKTAKVMMYCTGGIRCELYSALLKEKGFENVYQLDGGVIQYGLSEGAKHWKGKLFVFDDRLSVPISEKDNTQLISCCFHCNQQTDLYFNCANVDCNELFFSCPDCAEALKGCCCDECCSAPRLRIFKKTDRPKPYRRLSEEG